MFFIIMLHCLFYMIILVLFIDLDGFFYYEQPSFYFIPGLPLLYIVFLICMSFILLFANTKKSNEEKILDKVTFYPSFLFLFGFILNFWKKSNKINILIFYGIFFNFSIYVAFQQIVILDLEQNSIFMSSPKQRCQNLICAIVCCELR